MKDLTPDEIIPVLEDATTFLLQYGWADVTAHRDMVPDAVQVFKTVAEINDWKLMLQCCEN